MEEMTVEKVDLSTIQKNMKDYFETHDVKYVPEDGVFKDMGSGEEFRGREAVAGMLHYIYHVAFDAKADVANYIITEDKAMVEGFFKGKHIGEFSGMQPTNKDVNVPLCVTYDLENGLIREGRVYMPGDVIMRQLQA